MITYKGFDENLRCYDSFQYEAGKEYTHTGKVEICKSGFHSCENPLDIFKYFKPNGKNRFAKTEISGTMDKEEKKDTKIASSKIKISLELKLKDIINAGIKFIFERIKHSSTGAASGDYSTGAASGYSSTGAASGESSTGAASGESSTGAASGDYSTGAASGYSCKAIVTGKHSIAVVNGQNSSAQGTKGNWLVLSEYNDRNELIDVVCKKVDGKNIKENIFYTLKNGKFTKVK